MAQFSLDKSQIDRLEHDIRPLMAGAITIPTSAQGIAIYVVGTAFLPWSEDDLRAIAERLVLEDR